MTEVQPKEIEKEFTPQRIKSEIPLKEMEFKEPFVSNEVKLQDGEEIEGFYDGIFNRELQEESPYTGEMTAKQIGLVIGGDDYKFVWATPGLLKALKLQEVEEGDKIKIVRQGKDLNTSWGVIHLR